MNVFDLIINDREAVSLEDVFLNKYNHQNIQQLIKEHRYVDELTKYGLPVNNKILLQGHSGCGKTTTAKAIAHALGKPIMILNLSNVVCSRIGETSQNLKQVFDKAAREKAVLFLDEFDQIGKERGSDDKDVGEMRRLVNTIIQLIDYYPANAMLIAASNHAEIIDIALLRRFQLRINFEMPNDAVLDSYYDRLLKSFPEHLKNFERLYHVSFAEAKDYAFTKIKSLLIAKLEKEENK
ncbi:AAA family ATPase [Chryseobacterium salivictor]|uniref:ATP-dependent zinc metalloprotease FtsH 1 n=1 Tax=Chryseobacterium salivictor TaxID=2547600 RepID=A0A4P6ZD43_9FLAO|nr:ATP-binding protein [Chryseobacterium salivictor]QBO57431.1 ATP-dependent zinc metalloprotease FtsH 1 [Chryseobacterium salivictor]